MIGRRERQAGDASAGSTAVAGDCLASRIGRIEARRRPLPACCPFPGGFRAGAVSRRAVLADRGLVRGSLLCSVPDGSGAPAGEMEDRHAAVVPACVRVETSGGERLAGVVVRVFGAMEAAA